MLSARIINGDYLNLESSYRSVFVHHVSLHSMVTLATKVITSSLAVSNPSFNLNMFYFSNHPQHRDSRCKKPLCLSLLVQDAQMTTAPPDDGGSVLMDDTSSQWSSVADSEEERRGALEKSMYVFGLFDLY